MGVTMVARFSFLLLLGLIMSGLSYGAEPTCHTTSGEPYCRYEGKVDRLYVNDKGLIIFYFDTAMQSGAPESVGISGISNNGAGAVSYKDYPGFSQYFYSTALAASASGQEVSLQMRGRNFGYLKIDRIWLKGN